MTGSAITEGYGMSECSPIATTNFPNNIRVGTVGVPVPDTDVRIVDVQTGETEVPIGEVGEITIKGPQVMLGYLDNPTETANTLRKGWLYTGDLATMDEDGFITIVDRKKDMIISGGLNIFPSEIEGVLSAFPGVAECAVVGEKNPKWGEKVVAYIVHQPGVTILLEDLQAHCRASLAGYKIPREFRVVEALPVSFLGKLQRAELRRQADQAAPAADSPSH
jgi:long-chain acyl-CoA synthetase